MSVSYDDGDIKRLEKSIKRLGKLPQKCVTKAAKKGGSLLMKAVKQNAPVDTGSLKSGLKLKGEKSKTKGKKGYQVTFSAEDNDIFQKRNAEGKITGYYPVSQEYGFRTKNGKYVPGFRYMKNAAEENAGAISGIIIQTLDKEIDKEWNKK